MKNSRKKWSRPVLFLTVLALAAALVSAAAADGWNSDYEEFVMEGTFLVAGTEHYLPDGYEQTEDGIAPAADGEGDFTPIWIALYDMDADETPELIIFNGETALAETECHVYTWKDGEVSYIGPIGWRECLFDISENEEFPGLFSMDGLAGNYEITYWHIQDGHTAEEPVAAISLYGEDGTELEEPRVEQITQNDALYNQVTTFSFLPTMTYAEILETGWENFLQMCMRRGE